MSNRQLEDAQERYIDEKVAEYIGLTYEEYISLDPQIEENASDDGLIYSYLVNFGVEVPEHIKDKIQAWGGNAVELPPGFFEEPDDDYAEPEDQSL